MAHSAELAGRSPPTNSISVPFVVLAAIVSMVGLFSLLYWVITFQWLYFLGVLPMAIGALMLFHPLAGSNRATG